MILDFVPVINAIIILVAMLLLGRTIAQNFRKEREHNQVIDNQILQMIEDINSVTLKITDTQKFLDRKMNELTRFLDSHYTNVGIQQDHFNMLAKADMLAARREELVRTKELKAALERLMGVALTSRQPPSPNDVIALEKLSERIEELEEILS